jgi:flagellar FliL protein
MADAAPTTPAPKKSGNILGLAFAGVNLAVLAFGSFLVFKSTIGVEHKSTSDAEAKAELAKFEETLHGAPVLYNMGQFNTNLDGVPRRMVRLDVSLEMMDEEGYEEVIGITPQARDEVMRILQDKTYADVESVQGKLQLKNQIVAQLNADLKKGVVKNVYFNELVVQ